MKTQNHYEQAFAAYLREHNVIFLPTLEIYRNFGAEKSPRSLKNLDFVVLGGRTSLPEVGVRADGSLGVISSAKDANSPPKGSRSWLVDIKGRQFPSGQKHPQYWRNWVTRDDLASLARWEFFFGTDFHGLFVFAYEIMGNVAPLEPSQLFYFGQKIYAFVGVPRTTYEENCRTLSVQWNTVTLPTSKFRRCARPMDFWLDISRPEE